MKKMMFGLIVLLLSIQNAYPNNCMKSTFSQYASGGGGTGVCNYYCCDKEYHTGSVTYNINDPWNTNEIAQLQMQCWSDCDLYCQPWITNYGVNSECGGSGGSSYGGCMGGGYTTGGKPVNPDGSLPSKTKSKTGVK